jgi:CHAT domain-containing protein
VGNINEISRLKERIGTYYYEDFDSVQHICSEIIRLSREQNMFTDQLEAIYTLCWCANEHKRMQEFRSFMLLGSQLMKDREAEFRRVDPTNMHVASMIHATGVYYFDLGDYEDAIAAFSKIITLGGKPLTTDRGILGSACNYLGQSYQSLGNLDKSIQFFGLANSYLQKSDENYDFQHALFNLYQAEYQFSMGEIQDAFASLKTSLHLLDQERDNYSARSFLKSNLLWIASFYQRIEAYDSAILYVNKAIALHTRNDPDFPLTYRVLGDIYYKNGQLDSALSCYTKSLNLIEQQIQVRSFTKSSALVGIGNVYRDRQGFEKARTLYREAFDNLLSQDEVHSLDDISSEHLSSMMLTIEGMDVLVEQARLFKQWFQHSGYRGYLDSCINMLEKALLINDINRRELTSVETKESKTELQTQITDMGVEVSFKAYALNKSSAYLGKAFAFMEKGKGNILMDQLLEVRAKKFSGIPEEVLEKEVILRGELAVYRNLLLTKQKSAEEYPEIRLQYDEKQRAYISLISEMERQYPQYYKLKYNTRTIPVEEIQHYLTSSRTLIIQYHIGKDKIYMAGITKNQVVLKATDRNDEFDRNLYTFLKQLGKTEILEAENDRVTFNEFIGSSRYLYLKVLSPILDELKSSVKDLTFIPDGYLCYMPFEILLTEEPHRQEVDYAQLPYLIKKYRISYDYSASLLVENAGLKYKTRFAYRGYAPSYGMGKKTERPGSLSYSFGSLYANREEIEACKNIWNGIAVMENKATETAFREYQTPTRILHLAIHTFLDDKDPRKSFFAFAEDSTGADDGYLYTYELYSLNIPAQLVILSGCETGIGHIRKGEGIMSLARAFKFAGCPNILMSLWKVNDETTKEIMIAFNQNLKKGMEKDKALQQAKLSYLKGSKNLHPVFWSSFVLIGNNDPIQHSRKPWLLSSLFLCLLLILLTFMKWGKR